MKSTPPKSKSATSNIPDIQEVAQLVQSMDPALAQELLARLSPAERASIERAADGAREPVRASGAAISRAAMPVDPMRRIAADGVELEIRSTDPTDPAPAASGAKTNAIGETQTDSLLAGIEPSALLPLLAHERPQTIAAVLSTLPPESATHLLLEMPDDLQDDVIARLGRLSPLDQASLKAVELHLREWQTKQESPTTASGLTALQQILTTAGGSQRQNILKRLRKFDIDLAHRLGWHEESCEAEKPQAAREQEVEVCEPSAELPVPRDPPVHPVVIPPEFEFESLLGADRTALGQVLRQLDCRLLAIALVGTEPSFTRAIEQLLTPSQQSTLAHERVGLNPLRLSDVETAQRRVMEALLQSLVASPAAA